MRYSLSLLAVVAGASAAAAFHACPLYILVPPPGTDVVLCNHDCQNICSFAEVTEGVCTSAPEPNNERAGKFEVLTNKLCTIYSDAKCNDEVAQLVGVGSVSFNQTYIGSVKCTLLPE